MNWKEKYYIGSRWVDEKDRKGRKGTAQVIARTGLYWEAGCFDE